MSPLVFLLLSLLGADPSPAVTTSPPPDAAAHDPVAAPPAVAPGAVGKPVRTFQFSAPGITHEERAELDEFLQDLISKKLDDTIVREAELRLASIRKYKKVACHATDEADVMCTMTRARILRSVDVEGLPPAILETDVMKRVFLKPGEPLDEEEAGGKSRLLRQRQRIEELLDREGFIGAEVRLIVHVSKFPGEYNVLIRVRGGSFVKVHRVILKSFGPLSQQDLTDSFGRMCLTSEGLLDGFFVGNFTSCFNRRRLQATTERFTENLHNLGYPEARLHVIPTFIDPLHSTDEACALPRSATDEYQKEGLKPPPQCVDLSVEVEQGTKVVAGFHNETSEQRKIVEVPETLSSTSTWIRETFTEPVSRFLQILSRAEPSTALDTDLVDSRLKESLSFQQAGAVDETEVAVSAQNAERYIGQRNHINARVDVNDKVLPGERVVDFNIAPVPIAAVRTVRFVGNKSLSEEEIMKSTELAAHPRTFANSGTVSAELLDDDENRIRTLYAEHGFPEANVQAVAGLGTNGDIDVTFVIDEGATFFVSGVILAGGSPMLTPDVLQAIKHCDGGLASLEKRKPVKPDDCKGAPLRPEELEADSQRVQQVYAAHGFPNVDATVETSFETDGTKVRITVVPPNATAEERAHPKDNNVRQVVLGEVFLEGNQLTRRDVLLREAGLEHKDGAPLDPIALGKGISRLRRSGLYNSVELQYLGLDGSFGDDRSAIRLSVQERPAFTVDTSVGFSTEQLFTLRLEVRHKNIFGTMLDADWLTDFGLFFGRFSQTAAQIRWPRILGTDISASFVPISLAYLDQPAGAFLLTPSTAAGQKAGAAWAIQDVRRRLFSVGGSFSVDWRLHDVAPIFDDKLDIGASVELRYDWLNPAADPIPAFSAKDWTTVDGLVEVVQQVDATQVAALTPRLAYNDVDNPFDPKKGFGFELFLRGSPPYLVRFGPFGVFGATGRAYATLGDRLTFAIGARTRLGWTAPVKCPREPGCEWALMQNDLLLLGGERSVRGVPENQIGVLSPAYDSRLQPIPLVGNQIIQVRPGLYSGVLNAELRYQLIREFFIGSLEPAVFFDSGFSTDSFPIDVAPWFSQSSDLRYAWSLGAGLRLVTPVGPLAVDFAYAPPRNTSSWYLSLGYLF